MWGISKGADTSPQPKQTNKHGGEREGDHNLGPKALQSLQLLDQDKALAYEFIRGAHLGE